MRPLIFLLATTAALAVSTSAQTSTSALPEPVEIVKLEQHLWTTMAEGGFASTRNLFAPDFIQVDDQIEALDALLVNLKHCRLDVYELRDLQVRILTPDSALTAYHAVYTFKCGTEAKTETRNYDSNSVTVWVRQPGKQWLAEAHTETPAKPSPVAAQK